jgi:hypothetical protein
MTVCASAVQAALTLAETGVQELGVLHERTRSFRRVGDRQLVVGRPGQKPQLVRSFFAQAGLDLEMT